MSADHLIFVGFELTEAVAALVDGCAERDRVYLEDPSFLETVSIDGKRFVGKRVKDGAAIDRIEDTARSVVSLLTRVSPSWKPGAAEALVMAVEEDLEVGEPLLEDDEGESARFDYLGLVD